MIDKTTNTLHTSMRQIVDMAPMAPSLPEVPEQRGTRRPVLALASGFAAVMLFVGVGVVLLASGDDPVSNDSGAGGSDSVGIESVPEVGVPPAVIDGDSPPTTIAFATPDDPVVPLTPEEHEELLVRCLLDAELDVALDETGITFDNRVVDVAVFESTVEACDRYLVEQGFKLPGDPFTAPRP